MTHVMSSWKPEAWPLVLLHVLLDIKPAATLQSALTKTAEILAEQRGS